MAKSGKGCTLSQQALAPIGKDGAGQSQADYSPFTQRLLVASWTPARPLHSEATRASHTPDEIDEDAFVVVLQVGQLVEEVRVHAIQTFLSHAVGVLASEGPIRREVVVHIERRDVALLKELGCGVLQSHLTHGRHVIKVRVLDQRV